VKKEETKPDIEQLDSLGLEEDLQDGMPEITSIHLQDLSQDSEDFEPVS
jgi:hypothetical protein